VLAFREEIELPVMAGGGLVVLGGIIMTVFRS
jgi:hypothetical protein